MPSTTLVHDTVNNLPGLNLKWTHTDLSAIREITLIHYKNAPSSVIASNAISPSLLKVNVSFDQFDSGASYSAQLQVTDVLGVTVYSNIITLTSPMFLSKPVIASIGSGDAKLTVVLQSTTNTLTASDKTEFVIRRQSDGQLFWIVMPYAPGSSYVLQSANLINGSTYSVACMYQPDANNTQYSAPSAISDTVDASPTNFPNTNSNITVSSVGTATYDMKVMWSRPSDYADWSDTAFIDVKLMDSLGDETIVRMTDHALLEYTFTNLAAGLTYKAQTRYGNAHGVAIFIESNAGFITLTKLPGEASLSLDATDGIVIINVTAPADMGQAPVMAYEIVDENDGFIRLLASTETTDVHIHTSLTNGLSYGYKVRVQNVIGFGPRSPVSNTVPFGAMSIVSAVPIAQTLTVTINPNGKPVERIIMLGIDQDPTEELVANSIIDIPQQQISQNLSGNITVFKTFNGLSSDLSFYLVVAHCNDVVDFVKSN